MKVRVKLPEKEERATGLYDREDGVKLGQPELREDQPFPKISGYAAVFNVLSLPLFFGVREKIRPGAFTRALKEGQDVRGLVDHKPSMILGRTKAGTLRLREDDHGLHYEIDPPDTTVGRDVIVSLRRKDVDQSSFAFRVKEEEYNIKKEDNGDKTVIRELIDVDLFDVSVVTYPAYPQTSVSVRNLWPEMKEEEARTSAETWVRNIRDALDPRVTLLPRLQRTLRLRRLEMLEPLPEIEERAAGTEVQTIIFMKTSWTADRAKTWLKDHNFSSDKMDETGGSFRFRQFDPSLCAANSYKTLTENMPRGVRMVVCKKKA